jgi:hypothetical protein
MWRKENGRAVLNLSAVDRTEFKVVSENGFHLVCPRKNKWNWVDGDRWLRSVVVDNSGRIVSCSWPKFGNFGEFRADTETLERILAKGGLVRFTHKEDGSLCVRSVVGGRVVMRTRGTLAGGESDDGKEAYGERFRRVAVSKYPKLLDPSWMSDVSLLLEYISPDNTVVVRHKEEDLVFLGGVEHGEPSIIPWPDVAKIAIIGGLRLVELRELPSDLLELLREVNEWRTEGVVARCDGDQVLVKVKSAWYLANHRMKYSMNYKIIVEFIDLSGVLSEDELVARLREYDYDFEIVEGGREFYRRYVAARDEALALRAKAEMLYSDPAWMTILFDTETARRKYFARIACAQPNPVRSMMFALYDGRMGQIDAMVRQLILTEGGKHK